jgi:two-component system LytT family response regulator
LRVVRERLLHEGVGGGLGRTESLRALLSSLKGGRAGVDRLAIKVDGRVIFLRTGEIEWLEAEGNYVRIHAAGASHVFRDTLSAIEANLPADQFLRISRSVVVNLDSVREFQPLFYGDYAVLLRDGRRLTLSRHYRERLERWLERRVA